MDKLRFARLVAWVATLSKFELDDSRISQLNELTCYPESVPVDGRMVQYMIEAMASGKTIEAIKSHRSLTGFGLKESKDAIENITRKYMKGNTTRWVNVYRRGGNNVFIGGTYENKDQALNANERTEPTSEYIGPKEISFDV